MRREGSISVFSRTRRHFPDGSPQCSKTRRGDLAVLARELRGEEWSTGVSRVTSEFAAATRVYSVKGFAGAGNTDVVGVVSGTV